MRHLVILGALLWATAACNDPLPAAPDADADAYRPGDGGGDADADMDRDGSPPGDGDIPEDLRSAVLAIIEPLVDPSGADTTRAVGLVVAVITPSITDVVGAGALVVGGAVVPDGGTVFQIGSVTKIVTGLILAMLVDEGLAEAADPVDDHLAADVDAPSFGGHEISLEQLVTHYSSLPEMPDNTTGRPGSPAADYSREQLAELFGRLVLDEAPGTNYFYSNLGSGLLGVALADSTGETHYDGLLRSRITGPLGMSATGTNEPGYLDRIGERLAQGYAVQDGSLIPFDPADMGVLAGGGEILSTGDDMARLLRAFTGLEGPVSPGALDLALTPLAPGSGGTRIAYAIDVVTGADGELQFEKAGVTSGYTSFVAFRRQPAVAVAILSNRNQHRSLQAAAREILDLLADRG